MRPIVLHGMLLVLLLGVGPAVAQTPSNSFDLGRYPIPTADGLVEQIGSEEDARLVVLAVLERELRVPLPWNVSIVRLVGTQVRRDWVPWNIVTHVVRLDDDAARTAFRDCGYLYLFQPAMKSDGILTIAIAIQNRCQGTARTYRLRRTASGWEAEAEPTMEGWDTTHCECS